MAAALLDGFEATLERHYFELAEATMKLALEKYGDREGGGFFDRSSDAPPMGGIDVRRKPLQDSPTPGGNAIAIIVLDRLYAYTGERKYRDVAQAALEAFAGTAPQYGLFAATYGLASVLHARHSLQIVVTGTAQDETAWQLERRARSFYRFGKAVLRVTPELSLESRLPPALAETVPHLRADQAQAFVCAAFACYPPASDPEQLSQLLSKVMTSGVMTSGEATQIAGG
jgi:uncharacterized protein YyaL (SSP411 family)